MKRSHQIAFERAFERLYIKYCKAGMSIETAREKAADDAWTEYQERQETIERLGMELNAIACALGVGTKK